VVRNYDEKKKPLWGLGKDSEDQRKNVLVPSFRKRGVELIRRKWGREGKSQKARDDLPNQH